MARIKPFPAPKALLFALILIQALLGLVSGRAVGTHALVARGGNDAGLGIELENTAVLLKSDTITDTTAEDLKNVKGAVVDGEDHDDWQMTAEHASDQTISVLYPEWIIKGTNVKLGSGQAGKAASEIVAQIKKWAPSNQNGAEVKIKGFDQDHWKVSSPSTFNADSISLGQQVTAALPLEAIQDLFLKARTGRKHPLIGTAVSSRISHMHVVQKSHIDPKGTYPLGFLPDDASDDVLGFLSLLVSYAKYADATQATDSPKLTTPIMPRTDFITIFGTVKDKIGALSCGHSLYDIVKDLAVYKGDGTNDYDSNWKSSDAKLAPSNKMDTMQFSFKDSLQKGAQTEYLPVRDWLVGLQDKNQDLLKEKDKIIDGQVGGLNNRMETVLGTSRLVPLFEFRDLGSSKLDGLENQCNTFETAIVDYHDSMKNAPTRRSLRGLFGRDGPSCPTGPTNNSTSSCTGNQAATGAGGKCEDCPEGQKPDDAHDKCVEEGEPVDDPSAQGKCPEGKVLDPAEGGQDANTPDPVCIDDPSKKCPAGQVPESTPQYDAPADFKPKCGKDADEKDKPKCPNTQYSFVEIDEKGNAKYSCKDTRKTEGKGKGSNQPKSADPDEEGKKARMKFCLAFVAGSGLLDGAEDLRTDVGAQALNDSASDWPAGVEYKPGELTDSNMDIDLVDSTRPQPVTVTGTEIATRKLRKRQLGFLGLFEEGAEAAEDGAIAGGRAAEQAAADARVITKAGGAGKAGKYDDNLVKTDEAADSATQLSKAKAAIDKIRNDKSFQDCLSMLPTAVADAELHIDDVPEGGFKAEQAVLAVVLDTNEDGGDTGGYNPVSNVKATYSTHVDTFWHNNRIFPNQCHDAGPVSGKISAYEVTGGCCTFYADKSCAQPLFSATNRQDMNLKGNGGQNDMINSFACGFDLLCAGQPGHDGSANATEYATGWCGAHIVQHQRQTATDHITFDVTLFDSNQIQIGQATGLAAADTASVTSKLPNTFDIDVHGDADVDFTYGSSKWNSDSGSQCHFGAYDGSKGHAGKRTGDCGFTC